LSPQRALPNLVHVTSESIAVVGEVPGVHRVWAFHNVMVVSWSGTAADAVRRLAPIADRLLTRTRADKLSFVHLVPNNLAMPDAATRAALLELGHAYGDRTACIAVIVSGTGFWASAIRSVITGIRVLAPRAFDLRMHASLPELLQWFPEEHARKTGVTLEPSELLLQLERAGKHAT